MKALTKKTFTSIHAKAIVVISLIIAAVVIVLNIFFLKYERLIIFDGLKDRGTSISDGFSDNAEYPILTLNKTEMKRLVLGVMKQPDIEYAAVYNSKGNILISRGIEILPSNDIMDEVEGTVSQEHAVIRQVYLPGGKRYYDFTSTVSTEIIEYKDSEMALFGTEKKEGAQIETEYFEEKIIGYVRIGVSLRSAELLIRRMRRRIFLITVVIMTVAAAVVVVLITIVLRPVKRLMTGIARLSQGDLDYHVKVDTRDEFGDLAQAFNKMTNDLKKSTVSIGILKKSEDDLRKAYGKLKETQGQLIQAEKMQTVGRLASGVAHEVKNPLGIVLQSIDYVEKKIDKQDETSNQVLEIMRANIERADNIICSLVDFSRAEKLTFKPRDINKILMKSFSLIKHRIMLDQIEVVELLDDKLPEVMVDEGKMEQVFINVLLNAAQSIGTDGGKINLRTYLGILDSIDSNTTVRNLNDKINIGDKTLNVEIEDSGSGILKENLQKLFDPFFSTKGPRGGTGLGLSVTKNIIDLHNGIIEIGSEEGKGAKVRIIFKLF